MLDDDDRRKGKHKRLEQRGQSGGAAGGNADGDAATGITLGQFSRAFRSFMVLKRTLSTTLLFRPANPQDPPYIGSRHSSHLRNQLTTEVILGRLEVFRLFDVVHGPAVQGLQCHVGVASRQRADHDDGHGIAGENGIQCLQAVHARHLDIERNDVGTVLFHFLQSVLSVACLGHYGETGLGIDNVGEEFTKDERVVDNQDADRWPIHKASYLRDWSLGRFAMQPRVNPFIRLQQIRNALGRSRDEVSPFGKDAVHICEDRFFRPGIEIDKHVLDYNQIERTGFQRLHQIVLLKLRPIAQDRFGLPRLAVDLREKPPPKRLGHLLHGPSSEPGLASFFESSNADISAEDFDFPLRMIGETRGNAAGDGIDLISGTARRRPDAKALGALALPSFTLNRRKILLRKPFPLVRIPKEICFVGCDLLQESIPLGVVGIESRQELVISVIIVDSQRFHAAAEPVGQ